MPGVRCKACEAKGQETWVIPGKVCHVCGAQCSLLKVGMFHEMHDGDLRMCTDSVTDTDVPFQEDEELKPYL